MFDDAAHGAIQQGAPGLDAVPRAGAAGMGQGNEVKFPAEPLHSEGAADEIGQRSDRDKLGDRQLPDGDHQIGLKQGNLGFEPARAAFHFIRRGDTVATGGRLPGEAAANRGHDIDAARSFRRPPIPAV